jgi:hypothetical protein
MTNEELNEAQKVANERLDGARADQAAKNVGSMGTYCGSLKVYTISAIREAARLAREGWTPPVAVDPDIAEARTIYHNSLPSNPMGMALAGIKRGRALAAAKAKPGMVWVKHDGSSESPIAGHHLIVARFKSEPRHLNLYNAIIAKWSDITQYAIITQPEGAA